MPSRHKLKITPRALLEIRTPSDVAIAPDGRRVVYTVPEVDWDEDSIVQHLHLRLADSDSPARQLTRSAGHEDHPKWSPDGKWLAFIAARDDGSATDGNGHDDEVKEQVWVLPMDGAGGEACKVTDAADGARTFDWLPDSSGIVYRATERRPKPLQNLVQEKEEAKDDGIVEREEKFRQQLWRVDVDGKKNKLIHAGDFGIAEIAVSPDGRLVAFTTNYTGETNDYHHMDIWTVEIATGETRKLTGGAGCKYCPRWAGTSESVVFFTTREPEMSFSQVQLHRIDIETRTLLNLTEHFPHDLEIWTGIVCDDQGRLYVLAVCGTATALYRFTGQDFEALLNGEEHIHAFHAAPNGAVAAVMSDLFQPPEIAFLDTGRDVEITALTDLNEEWQGRHDVAPSEVVRWNSADGVEVEGILTYPLGYKADTTYPLIVSLHGGPHGRAIQALTHDTVEQVYAAEGYAVLAPNYRGSEGYGDAFAVAIRGELGGKDYEDVLAGVDWALRNVNIDPDRIGVTGGSYGGYLANWAISQTDRFKAAVSRSGIFSLVTDFCNSCAPRWEQEYLGAAYWDNPALYAERSPSTFVTRINTPVLIIHGEDDTNTFISNSQEMYNALFLLGKTVQYVRYPREGHNFGEPMHCLDEIRRTISWFDKYLGVSGQPESYRIGDTIAANGWELRVAGANVADYVGLSDKKARFIEIAFVLRDTAESRAPLTIGPADITLARGLEPSARRSRPAGLPVSVLGEKVLAVSAGWKIACAPAKEQRGLAVPVAVAFRVAKAGGTYALRVKDFPPVMVEVPAADEDDQDANHGKDA